MNNLAAQNRNLTLPIKTIKLRSALVMITLLIKHHHPIERSINA